MLGDGDEGLIEFVGNGDEMSVDGLDVDRLDGLEAALVGQVRGMGKLEEGLAGDTSGVGDLLEMGVDGAAVEVEPVGNLLQGETLLV